MKLIRIKYYNNWAAIPMMLCLPLGSLLLSIGLATGSGVGVIGMILLVLFVVLKIINSCLGNRE